jgi:hypothetical protein
VAASAGPRQAPESSRPEKPKNLCDNPKLVLLCRHVDFTGAIPASEDSARASRCLTYEASLNDRQEVELAARPESGPKPFKSLNSRKRNFLIFLPLGFGFPSSGFGFPSLGFGNPSVARALGTSVEMGKKICNGGWR